MRYCKLTIVNFLSQTKINNLRKKIFKDFRVLSMIRPLRCLRPIRERICLRSRRTIFSGYRMAQKASPIYVSEAGADDGTGTLEKPWKSVLEALINSAGNVRYS